MEPSELLKERFIEAIRKSFRRTPLIGPKWFRFHPDGEPADFEFLGARKLAKALKRGPMAVAETIVGRLDLAGLDAEVRILPDTTVCVDLGGRTEPDGPSPVS